MAAPELAEALRSDLAIQVSGVRKRFRKYTVRGQYTTLKSTLVSRLLRRGPETKPAFLQVLDDVDLEVPRGEAVGIIGRNGSGKSTLLKLIAGILQPDAGSVRVDGRISPLIELGAGFHPELSGRENIFLNGIVLGMSKDQVQDRFDDIVGFAELGDFIDDPVRTYSSGMYVRLGFSIAVHADPDVLLVDEVLAVGDESFSRKCERWLGGFLEEGKTVLLVSHSLSAIRKWCRHVVWLDYGRVRLEGPVDEVVDAYEKSVGGAPAPRAPDPDSEDKGKVVLEEVEIDAGDGKSDDRLRLGDAVTLTIRYRVLEPVEGLVVGIAIRREDGVHCYGTNTGIEGVEVSGKEGTGVVRCRFRNLNFLDGDYQVDVALRDRSYARIDKRVNCGLLVFRSGMKESGVFRPDHEWVTEGEG